MTEQSKSDPFVGGVFEDLDPRSVGRRIRVVSRGTSLFGGERYRGVRLNEHGHDVQGHPVNLTRAELENDYRKETTMASENKAAIEEMRKAAGSIREVVRRLMRRGDEKSVALCKRMGFSGTEQARAVAAVLEEASDEAWLKQEAPSELIVVVARIVNGAAL